MDWAEKGLSIIIDDENKPSLFLGPITSGNRNSIEWFLSDEPERKYVDFVTIYKNDSRLKDLYNAEGFVNIVSKWIQNNRK